MPKPVAMAVARAGTQALDRFVPRLRRIGRVNLSFAMPETSEAERERILDEVFLSIARMLVVFARFPGLKVNEWIHYDGLEHFEAAKRAGRGALFYTAHLGNWELSAFAHGVMTEPMGVVVRPLDNPLLDELARRYRSLGGNEVIEKKDARPLLRLLKANRAVGILADQNAAPEAGVFVPFFDLMLRPEIAALTMSGSSLIVATNAVMLKRLQLPDAEEHAIEGALPG